MKSVHDDDDDSGLKLNANCDVTYYGHCVMNIQSHLT